MSEPDNPYRTLAMKIAVELTQQAIVSQGPHEAWCRAGARAIAQAIDALDKQAVGAEQEILDGFEPPKLDS